MYVCMYVYVVSVNEFSATCNWQVVGVQVEQNRCKDRALRKAVTLGSPSTGVIAHVHPETSISKQQTHLCRAATVFMLVYSLHSQNCLKLCLDL